MRNKRIYYYVATEFGRSVWWRLREDWDRTWQHFYEDVIQVKLASLWKDEILILNFNWVLELPPSFITEAFWRLYKENGWESVWEMVMIKSDEDLTLEDTIKSKAIKYETT